MSLTVLNVAFPLAPVGADAVGGAEQVLTRLDEALVRAGHRSIVVACAGSRVHGTLLATPAPPDEIGEEVKALAAASHRRAIFEALERWPIDVVHLHGIDFHRYLPPPGPPALVTLHLPPSWYPAEAFRAWRPNTHLHCVSASQHAACPPRAELLSPIENGVPVDRLAATYRKRGFVLALGRICPEKGFHIALDAARRAERPMLLAGHVYGYDAHRRYFDEEIRPRLDRRRRFVGAVGFRSKRRLLTEACCLVAPSLAPETSSLVAMEALACGTPVIAFANGALSEIVEPGRTGVFVADEREMAEAIGLVDGIDPERCRHAARDRFSLERMTARYLDRYRALVAGDITHA